MGNFSRDPKARLADSVAKHYVGVRLQQGVPVLDADWNELEDLRRHESETIRDWFIGNGIPARSDGFLISEYEVSQVNDFSIRKGVCIVKGQLAENDSDVRYTTQPNFGNSHLDEPLLPLSAANADKQFIVYLDVWEREVDSQEDPVLVDNRIGVETAIRLKREWAVRVAGVPEDLSKLDNPPSGHAFYRLARLSRRANNNNITKDMIVDLRDTQLSVQRKIEVRNTTGIVVVDNQRFRQMLENTRNNLLAFIRYITTQFNTSTTLLTAAEVLGLQAAEHIARTAETGLGLVNTESIANRGVLNFLFQVYNAEDNFMTVWHDVVLQLGGTPKKYASYQDFINRLDQRLHQPSVGVLTGLLPALQRGDLEAATTMQEEIVRLFGTASANIPHGSIQVFLAKSPPGNLTTGPVPARFEFRVRSFTTLADTYTVKILPETGWPRMVVDSLGNPIPNNKIPIGASGSETTIFIDVTVQTGSTNLQLRVTSDANPIEIDQLTGLFALTQNQPPPIGEDKVQLRIESGSLFQAILDPSSGTVSIKRTVTGSFEVRIFNNTGTQQTFNVTISKQNEVGAWTAVYTGDSPVPINNNSSVLESVDITPAPGASSMQLQVTATTTIAGSPVTGQIVIPLVATP